MSDIKYVTAPWSDDLVKKLNDYQENGGGHPYTCGPCRDKYHTRFVVKNNKLVRETEEDFNDLNKKFVSMDRNLVATKWGWVCHTCDDIQDWCIDLELM